MKAVKPAPLLPTEALVRLADLDERDFNTALRTSGEQIERSVAAWQLRHHKENQLLYYEPVSDEALKLHRSVSRVFGIKGGNKSGKTGLELADLAIEMTGVVPYALRAAYPAEKIRPPIRARLVVTSLDRAWDTNLKLKLQWFAWNGDVNADRLQGEPDLGHWGWIPRRFLINGDWASSWSEKHLMLTLNLHGDFGTEPGSTMIVMSHKNDLADFNQGSFHRIVEDEVPPEAIHRANRIRVLEVNGRLTVGGTPSDDQALAVEAGWFLDQVLAPGLAGSDPEEVEAIELRTEDNRTLSEGGIASLAKGLTPEQLRVRFHGDLIHLEGLIFPGVKEKPSWWCLKCVDTTYPAGGACSRCGAAGALQYCHVWDDRDMEWPGPSSWPTVFYMDPHQARPCACGWFKVDERDQWWQIATMEVPGDATVVRRRCEEFEQVNGIAPVLRKGDPKITKQANQYATTHEGQDFNIRRAFEEAGFDFEPANPNFTVGRQRVLDALKVNPYTRAPRLRIHRTCTAMLYQLTHFTWTSRKGEGTSTKEDPSKKNSDHPAVLRYFAMDDWDWRSLERLSRPLTGIRFGGGGEGRSKVTGW